MYQDSQELVLKSGTILRVRPVPMHGMLGVAARFRRPMSPTVKVQSVAGHAETVPASEDSPEYVAYIEKLEEYNRTVTAARDAFFFSYGVLAWKFPGAEGWEKQPPDDWHDAELEEAGLLSSNHRADFIKYVVLARKEDGFTYMNYQQGETAPVTEQEVAAAQEGFRTDQERATDQA